MITGPPDDSGSSANRDSAPGDALEVHSAIRSRDPRVFVIPGAVWGPATTRRDRGDRVVSARDIHMRALDRQTQWEIDFAGAGDLESALDACLDALALVGELSVANDDPELRWRTPGR